MYGDWLKTKARDKMMDHLEYVGEIVGDYRLQRWLGGGGFGNVYLAEEVQNGRQVAVKVLRIRLSKQEELRAFINEARAMRLRHPHIVPLLDFGLSHDDTPFLVMEYAPLGTLRDRHPSGTQVPLLTAVEYASQMASALQYAHNFHLVHRDVKPENMLVRSDGVILLSDFGIATAAHSSHSPSVNENLIIGTVSYMAPEQLSGKPQAASDQYSLAVVLYEWIAGRTPFQGTTIEVAMQHTIEAPPSLIAQIPELPSEVETVLFKALAKDYKERFPSVQEFLTALQDASSYSISHLSPSVQSAYKDFVLPPALLPLMGAEDYAPIKVPLMGQSTVTQPTELMFQTTPAREISSPVHRHHISKKKGMLLIFLIALLVAGGGYTYSMVNGMRTIRTTHAIHTTPTIRTISTIPANSSYDVAVAQHGVMFGFDAAHTHNNPYEHILNLTSVSQLHQAWTAVTGGLIDFSSPVIANGVVYMDSYDGKLYAFDAKNGQQKWTAATGRSINSSPAVANGIVYVGSNDGSLYAFDASSGRQKWIAATGSKINFSSPIVANGVVYVGSDDHKLHAFDANGGWQKWATPTGAYIKSSPALANGVVYVGSYDGKLYAFDANNGEQKWTAPTGGLIKTSPAVANGIVYVSSNDHKFYAFDANNGQQKWIVPIGYDIKSSPAVANGIVYVGARDNKLHAFDANTGQQKWAAPTGAYIDSSPSVANGVVYVGSNDHNLYAFDANTGQRKWSAATGSYINSSPAIANGMVYIGSHHIDSYDTSRGKLYAYSLPS